MASLTASALVLRVAVKSQVQHVMAQGRTPAAARAAVAAAALAFDQAWASARPAAEARGAIACRAGCAACCHQHVAILPIEAVAIVTALRVDGARGAALARRVIEIADDIRALDGPARRRRRIPCPFLERSGSCTIHDDRPLRCRGLHSRDAARCVASTEPGADDGAFPLEPLRLADAALAGLAEGCAASAIPHTTLELSLALRALIEAPGRLDSVLAGADRIDEARMPAASDAPKPER